MCFFKKQAKIFEESGVFVPAAKGILFWSEFYDVDSYMSPGYREEFAQLGDAELFLKQNGYEIIT